MDGSSTRFLPATYAADSDPTPGSWLRWRELKPRPLCRAVWCILKSRTQLPTALPTSLPLGLCSQEQKTSPSQKRRKPSLRRLMGRQSQRGPHTLGREGTSATCYNRGELSGLSQQRDRCCQPHWMDVEGVGVRGGGTGCWDLGSGGGCCVTGVRFQL